MQEQDLDAVSQKFEFSSWRGTNRLDRELFMQEIRIPEGLIPGLDPAGVREIDPGDGSRLLRASWQVPDTEDALLVMDVRVCESRDAAHRVLLELLANMQAPDVVRAEADAPGDVAFSRASEGALVFARGNVVVSIHNGGASVVPVRDVATALDGWMVEQSARDEPR